MRKKCKKIFPNVSNHHKSSYKTGKNALIIKNKNIFECMTTLDIEFENSAKRATTLTYKPNNEELSTLYGLYKQATLGDNTTPRPGFLDLKGKAKWDAWTSKKGLGKDEAKRQYINFVKVLSEKI